MKKFKLCTLFILGACGGLIGQNAVAAPFFSQPAASQQLTQQINRADKNQQIVTFIYQTAEHNPALFATALLGGKLQYVSNPEVVYIGIKDTYEVLIISKVDDTDVGIFYHNIHQKGSHTSINDLRQTPSTHGFITLYQAD